MNKYERLAQLKLQLDIVQQEYDEYKNQIMETMLADGVDTYKTKYGTISIGKRKNWDYPDYVREYEMEYKEAKKKATRNGDAEYSETPFLSFRQAVEEEVVEVERPKARIH